MLSRDEWENAVWDSDLSPTQRLVALAFAKYAGKGTDRVYVANAELRRITGLGRSAALSAVRSLTKDGWLELVEKARQHYAPRYRLLVPSRVSARDTLRAVGLGDNPVRVSSRGTLTDPECHLADSRVSPGDTELLRTTRAREKQRCGVCNLSQKAHDLAESKLPVNERHEFLVMAA